MSEADTHTLKLAVEREHGGSARLIKSQTVKEAIQGAPDWEGTVHVFDLEGPTKSTRAYAWSLNMPDGKQYLFSVLHLGAITGPVEAIQAALATKKM